MKWNSSESVGSRKAAIPISEVAQKRKLPLGRMDDGLHDGMTDNEMVCCASFLPHEVNLLGITLLFLHQETEGEESGLTDSRLQSLLFLWRSINVSVSGLTIRGWRDPCVIAS